MGNCCCSERIRAEPIWRIPVQGALELEIAGSLAGREALLHEAMGVDPEYPPARWHAGQVRVGNEWLRVEEAERRASGEKRLAEYRRLRDERAGTPEGEVALARWCRKNRLEAEGRVHWLHVLQVQPQHEEALKALGMRWERGRLVTHEQAKRESQLLKTAKQEPKKNWLKHWEPLVARWQHAIEAGGKQFGPMMEDDVCAADSWRAMAGLSMAVLKQGQTKTNDAAFRTMSLKLVEILDESPRPWAVMHLAWHAVDHPDAQVRAAAGDALAHHPIHTYVPWLLARMRSPIEAEFTLVAYPGGGVGYQHSLYQEGLDADVAVTHNETFVLQGFGPGPFPGGVNDPVRFAQFMQQVHEDGTAASLQARAEAGARAVQTQRRAEAVNAATRDLNRRIRDALHRGTGIDLAEHPRKWWDWWRDTWYDYYELEKPSSDGYSRPVWETGA